jgi:hypothetical protein
METIRENLTEQEVLVNMLELACYLAKQAGNITQIDTKVKNLVMHFDAYTEDESED